MSRTGRCPVCSREMRLPAGAEGRKVQCRDCSSVLAIGDADGLRYELEIIRRGEAPSVEDDTGAQACAQCGAEVRGADTFCGACGADLAAEAGSDEQRKVEARRETAQRRLGHGSAIRKKTTRRAAGWLLALCVLFVIGGFVQFLMLTYQANKAYENLRPFADDQMLNIGITAGELRAKIDLEVMMMPAISGALAVLMLGLYIWARRSPFPAILTGLCTFLALILFNALVDPTTLLQGVIVKVLAIAGLVGGLKATLAERALARRAPQGA